MRDGMGNLTDSRSGRPRLIAWPPFLAVVLVTLLLAGTGAAYAARRVRAADLTLPDTGAASGFSILASSTVESSGDTTVTGDVGTFPGTTITGFPPAEISDGVTHTADASAEAAASDLATAYAQLVAMSGDAGSVSPSDLTLDTNGGPITPGVYTFDGDAEMSGNIELGLQDGDDPDGIVVFLVPGNLTADSDLKITLSGGLKSDHVFWQVGGAADLGSGTVFAGSVIASQGVTVGEGTRLFGKAVSLNDAVTLSEAHIDGVNAVSQTVADDAGTGGSSDTTDTALPATGEDDPATTVLPLALALVGLSAIAGGAMLARRARR